MPNKVFAHVAAAMWILGAGVAQAQTATAPSVLELVNAIRQAKDVSAASKAYVEARNADKKDPQVYKVFIQRMLEMGQPLMASIPATELTGMDPNDGLAWGVIGYSQASRGKIADAYAAIVTAAKLAPDNEGIMFNAGVLCAWQENTAAKPALPAEASSTAGSLKGDWASKKGFSAGQAAALAAFKTRDTYVKSLRDKITKTKEDIKDAQEKNKQLAEQWDALKRRSDLLETRMRTLDDQLKRYQADVARNNTGANTTTSTQLPSYVLDWQNEYRTARSEQAELIRQAGPLRQAAVARERAIARAQQDIERTGKTAAAMEKSDPTLVWKPPAVNGVIAGDASARPKDPAGVNDPLSASAPALSEGQRRLKMARMLVENNMRDKAIRELQAIIEKYPDSEIAREAQALLDKITL